MNLKELRNSVLETCDRVLQDGHDLEDMQVSLQIDDKEGEFFQSDSPSIDYDDNGNVSGCVIFGYNTVQKDKETNEPSELSKNVSAAIFNELAVRVAYLERILSKHNLTMHVRG